MKALIYEKYGSPETLRMAVSVPAKVLSLKPANLSFEEAAAVLMAGVTAPQQSAGGGSASTGSWPASRCIGGSTVPA
jgi:NADPH:quinone reductase-like Zn-dependent oxidoreductase